jgi:hypothetical protein
MSLLFSPIKIGGLTLRNRIVMPPMATAIEGPGGSREDTGLPSDATVAYYAERAQKQVGMVIVEHTYVTKRGKAHKGQLGLDNDTPFRVRASRPGAKNKRSRRSDSVEPRWRFRESGGHRPRARRAVGQTQPPVAEKAQGDDERRDPRGPGPVRICSQEGPTCGLRCGGDPLRPRISGEPIPFALTNTRTDEYGGSLENRARISPGDCGQSEGSGRKRLPRFREARQHRRH